MLKQFLLLIFLSISINILSQDFDAKKYTYTVTLKENTDRVRVSANLSFKKNIKEKTNLELDLVQINTDKYGMKIYDLLINGFKTDNFKHFNNKISIPIPSNLSYFSITINYSGVPKDGLIISKDNGNTTYFSDHWPNKARHWLASIDRPNNKVKVEFKVYAPLGYQVISNGLLKQEKKFNKFTYYNWETSYEIPTKAIALGVAKFNKIEYSDKPIKILGYAYNGNILHYEKSVSILKWFENKIGVYPFQKLVNVQSKTHSLGTENMGCIFYNEKSVINDSEQLIAHKISHQWFGNSITEKKHTDLWLSEGFATFLEYEYMKHSKGESAYRKLMLNAKKSIISYHYQNPQQVLVPSSVDDDNIMLNTYSYQKGAWFLYTLKKQIGEDLFWKIIRNYYHQFKFKNIDSNEFKNFIEKISKQDLNDLFDIWLYKPNLPVFIL